VLDGGPQAGAFELAGAGAFAAAAVSAAVIMAPEEPASHHFAPKLSLRAVRSSTDGTSVSLLRPQAWSTNRSASGSVPGW
jgi:hypothetical protein